MTSEAIILIAVVVAAVALSQSFLSAVSMIQEKAGASSRAIGDKISTSVKVIYAAGVNNTDACIWVKNIGTSIIHDPNIIDSDIFFGTQRNFEWYRYSQTGVGWRYKLLGDITEGWRPGETIEIDITSTQLIISGEYHISYITYNGIKSELFFNIEV